jgi:hypothetical protein
LASREPKSFSGSDGLQLTVDDGLDDRSKLRIANVTLVLCRIRSLASQEQGTLFYLVSLPPLRSAICRVRGKNS